jgi:hypothetical protein
VTSGWSISLKVMLAFIRASDLWLLPINSAL